jgi:hypothetical protein
VKAKAAAMEKIMTDDFDQIILVQAPQTFAGDAQIRSDFSPGVVIGGCNAKALAWTPS